MWSSWTESAKASLQQAVDRAGDALEKTGDVLTQAATTQKHRQDTRAEKKADPEDGTVESVTKSQQGEVVSSEGIYKNFQLGWSSVVESTKVGLQKASQVVEEQQSKIQLAMKEAQNEANGIVRPRPLHLPLDVAALQDAQVVYLTDRILTLSHPAMASASNGEITAERKLAAVGHLLQKRHSGRFSKMMEYDRSRLLLFSHLTPESIFCRFSAVIWNLSEVDYSHAAASIFEDQGTFSSRFSLHGYLCLRSVDSHFSMDIILSNSAQLQLSWITKSAIGFASEVAHVNGVLAKGGRPKCCSCSLLDWERANEYSGRCIFMLDATSRIWKRHGGSLGLYRSM